MRNPDLPGPLLPLQTMCRKSTNVTRVAPAGMWSAVALWALEPPASASLRRGKPAGMLRYFVYHVHQPHQRYAGSARRHVVGCRFATAWQARRYVTVFRIPCASTPPMLPCILTTFLKCKRLLAFPFSPSSYSKLMSRFFILRQRKRKKRT